MITNSFYFACTCKAFKGLETQKLSHKLLTNSISHVKKCRELTCINYNKQLGKKTTAGYKLRERKPALTKYFHVSQGRKEINRFRRAAARFGYLFLSSRSLPSD